MLKVLIADDETLFRDYLKTVIDWPVHGFQICAEAKNGQEALELARGTYPDIALIDINMPFLDGIALSQKLKEIFPDISIVLITGHEEFEYARRAMRIGVEDYLLKPFDHEELQMTLLKIKGKLQKVIEERMTTKDQQVWIKERLLHVLINNEFSITEDELISRLKRFGIRIPSDHFLVAAIEIDNMYQRWSNSKEILLWKNAVANILNEVIMTLGTHTVFLGPEGQIISLLAFEHSEEALAFQHHGYIRLSELVVKHFKFSVTIGIGGGARGLKEINGSYRQSLTALQNKIIVGSGKVIVYNRLAAEIKTRSFYPSEINEKLMFNLRLNDWTEVMRHIDEVFQHIRDQKFLSEFTQLVVMSLVSLCLSYITDAGHNISEILGEDFSPIRETGQLEDLDQTYQWIVAIFHKTLHSVGNNKISRSRKILETVKEFILENYMAMELSVDTVSKHVYMDSSYLYKIFKKELNMSVSDFITHTRMEKAKEIINQGNIRISDIAEMLGYSDAGYFSKCFKKYYGQTPSEYENQRKEVGTRATIIK
jgi:two-component system response regulator YesN